MDALAITKENFQQEVLDAEKTVLLDFYASWCGPCRALTPVIDEIARENPDIKVGKVNIDEEESLARQFKVMSVPSLFVFRGGELIRQCAGAMPKNRILEMLQ